jgi:hypothetical protein
MAITVPRKSYGLATALGLVQAHNSFVQTRVGANVHYDITPSAQTASPDSPTAYPLSVTVSNAVDLPTSISLLSAIYSVLRLHLVDAVSTSTVASGAHKIPDAVANASLGTAFGGSVNNPNGSVLPASTTLAAAITAANAVKALYNTHLSQAGVHANNDGTNTIAAANANDLASLVTLVNASKVSLNSHVAAAPATMMVNVISE